MAKDMIAVNTALLKEKSAALNSLALKISGRPCNIELSSCKGAFANEMQQMVSALNDVGSALTELALATASQIDNMCQQFHEADELAATQFTGEN